MGAALVLLLVGLGAMAAGVLIGRYYVPDDRQLRRTARHSRSYMRALSHLIARDHETVISELRAVVEENVEDVEPYFALGAVFRSRGEHERAIRVHQALALRERDRRKLRQRALYELGLDFRAAGMPRRATRAMEEVLLEEPGHEGALRVLAALYEEQARFNEAAGLWQRLGRRRGEATGHREHHLLVAAAQASIGRDDLDSAKQLLKAAQKHEESAHLYVAAGELAAARGNHRGARERFKQALIADPALAPHLLPGLIAAEQGLRGRDDAERRDQDDVDDFDDDARSALPQLQAGAGASRPQLAAAPTAQLVAASRAQLPAASSAAPASSSLQNMAASSSQLAPVAVSAPAAVSDPATPSSAPAPGSISASIAPGSTLASAADGLLAPAPLLADEYVAPTSAPSASLASPVAAPVVVNVASSVAGSDEGAAVPVRAARPAGYETLEMPAPWVVAGVLALLAEVEAQTGPRLELALIRAQLMPAGDAAAKVALADQLMARFPDSLAARVAAARLALVGGDPGAVRGALDALVSDAGPLAWALRGRWQCGHCGNRPGAFSWRCGQCRRWSTLRMETGVEPPPLAPRERRAAPRAARSEGLLGTSPVDALPAATLDPGLNDGELASTGMRRSLLGRVGGWVSGVLRRDVS